MEELDLYLRKSKISRERDRALSFRAQEERGRRWAEQHGYTVRKVWTDNLSAFTDTKRPGFEGALRALTRDDVPALWAYALDRFSRLGAGAVVPILDAGKRIIFDYERLDSADPRDRKHIINRAEEAREYSTMLSHRLRDTKTTQRGEGAWLGAAPYGLEVADPRTRKLRHADTWPVVLRIFEEVAAGKSMRVVARGLNADGIPSPRGGMWMHSVVHRVIINPVYEGLQVRVLSGSRGTPFRDATGATVGVFMDGVDPVPDALVQASRQVVAGHKAVPDYVRGKAIHLLSGLLRCAGCRGNLEIRGTSYTCAKHCTGRICPDPASVLREMLEVYVHARWRERLLDADLDDPSGLMVAVAKRWTALTRPQETEEHLAALAAVKQAEAAIEQLADDRAAGLYAGSMGKHFPRLVAEAEETLTVAKARVDEFGGGAVNLTMFDDWDLLDSAWEAADGPLRRDLLRLAVDSVTVRRAPHRGAPFDGDARCVIAWATAEDDA